MRCTLEGFVFELVDDGSLDTVIDVYETYTRIKVETLCMRLSPEFTEEFRADDGAFDYPGFMDLCQTALDAGMIDHP